MVFSLLTMLGRNGREGEVEEVEGGVVWEFEGEVNGHLSLGGRVVLFGVLSGILELQNPVQCLGHI